MKRILFIALLISLCAGTSRAQDNYSVEVLNGVPYLVEYGVPQGTEYSRTGRERLSLDGEWHFRIDPMEIGEREAWNAGKVDEKFWDIHNVPGVWQAQDPNLKFYSGVAWYRTSFKLPPNIKPSNAFLRFEGVNLFAKVWLNGTFLGRHDGGYTPFRFDISDVVKAEGENVLVVACDNRRTKTSVPPLADTGLFAFLATNMTVQGNPLLRGSANLEGLAWWPYGGIHRSVYIESAPPVNVVKMVVTATPKTGGGDFKVEGIVWNRAKQEAEVKLSCEISTADGVSIATYDCGKVVAPARGFGSFRVGASIDAVKPWSPSSPNLYDLTLTATAGEFVDSVTARIGFRTFEVADGKLKLNGKDVFLYGINRYEDDPAVGLAQTPFVISNDLDIIQDLGANFVRPGHHPVHPVFLDECDKRGIMVAEEIPLYRASGDQLVDPEIRSSAKLQIIEMIERDINHPSVVIWSMGSDAWSFIKNAGSLARDLRLTARRMDLVRPITMALLVVPHLTNRRDFIAPEMDVLFVNEFFGWLYGDISDAGRYLDFIHNDYPDKPIVVSQFGAHGLAGFRDPVGNAPVSEEWQAGFLIAQFAVLAKKAYLSGLMPWALADYRCPWYSEKKYYPYINVAGLMDMRRMPKTAFYAVKNFYRKTAAERKDGG